MKTTTQQQLWIHDSGAISEEHFGNYAREELGRTPRVRLPQTLAMALGWLAVSPKREW